jgi:hypothetical protein
MLRRLTLGLAGLSLAAAFVACNSNTTLNGGVGVGPNIPTGTLFAADSSRNGIAMYLPTAASGASPSFEIGGSSTTLNGPQYLAFDSSKNLWVTNFNPSTSASQILVFKYLATGAVVPLQALTYTLLGTPRGIALDAATGNVAIASVFTQAQLPALPSQIQLFTTLDSGVSVPYAVISGPSTRLNVPGGAAFFSGHIFVANRQGASVASYVLPTPTPTPKPTPSHSPTPSPSPSPSASPTSLPTAQVYYDVPPVTDISGANTGLISPTSVALDSRGNVYICDAGSLSVRVFKVGSTGNVKPMFVIAGSKTRLTIPLDIKVDLNGKIYVSDSGAGSVLIYPAIPSSLPATPVNEAPSVNFPTGNGLIGIAISP